MATEHENDLRVLVVLEANTIVVTILGTHYSITYRRLHDSPWLIASDIRDDQNSPISKWTFRLMTQSGHPGLLMLLLTMG